MIAEGAGHFRQPGLVERIARRLSAVPMSAGLRTRLKRWYVAVLSAQTAGRGLQASLPGGEVIRVLPEFAHVGWNPDEYRAFRDAVRPGMTVLDVGANVGGYALLFGQWVGRNGCVHAFEPAPAAHDGLVRHIALNGLDDIVRPVRAAVGAAPAVASLIIAGSHGESRLADRRDPVGPTKQREQTIEVNVTSIDEHCQRFQLTPAFIKVDVEGAELEVLRGARETIRRCRGNLALFVELHPSAWPHIGIGRKEIESELRAQALELVPIVAGSDPWTIEGMCARLVAR